MNWLTINASTIAAVVATIIAVAALWFQRRHNYGTVRPIASIEIFDGVERISVELKNNGTGPLIVERLCVINGAETKKDLIEWMPNLPNGIFYDDYSGVCDDPDDGRVVVLPPSSTEVLMKLSGDSTDSRFVAARDSHRRALKDLTVVVEYRDVYGRRMPRSQRKLLRFGANLPAATTPVAKQ